MSTTAIVEASRLDPASPLLDELRELLGERLSTSAAVRDLHGRDESFHQAVSPDAVAFARTTAEVSAIVTACARHKVPVIAYGADRFPLFYARGRRDIPSPRRLDHVTNIVQLCRTQWTTLGLLRGVVVANPVPAELAIEPEEVERIVGGIEAEPDHPATLGRDRTPDLLKAVAQQTGGRGLDANLGLLAENARLAARIAVELAAG